MTNNAIVWAYETPLPPKVKGSVHAVLVALCYSLNFKTGQCNPSVGRLAELTRNNPSTVKKAIRVLKALDLISLSSGKKLKKSNSYVIHYPAEKPETKGANSAPNQAQEKPKVVNKSANSDLLKGADSALRKGQNPTTEYNKEKNNLNVINFTYGKQQKKKKSRGSVFVAPTLEQVSEYCRYRGFDVDPSQFHAYYEANGWYMGRRKMNDWHAALDYWNLNQRKKKSDVTPIGMIIHNQSMNPKDYELL